MREKNPLLQVQSDPLHVQDTRKIKLNTELKGIDHEIECPRCHEVMILSSGFDRLGYSCEKCSFLFIISDLKIGRTIGSFRLVSLREQMECGNFVSNLINLIGRSFIESFLFNACTIQCHNPAA